MALSGCLSKAITGQMGPGNAPSQDSTSSLLAEGEQALPGTYFPNAVLAEVFVVAENDNFVGHGCADAEPALNLAGSKQVAALDSFEDVGRDVWLGGKVRLCQGLFHFLHVHETQGPLLSCYHEELL